MRTSLNAQHIRIATMNVLNTIHDFEERMQEISNQLRDANIDVLSLQECIFAHQGKDSDALENMAEELGMKYVITDTLIHHPSKDLTYGNVTLVKKEHAILKHHSVTGLDSKEANPTLVDILETHINIKGAYVVTFNVHLKWGGENEADRVQQAAYMARRARQIESANPNSQIFITGDFNTEADSDTVRYLTGKHALPETKGTFWIDIWDMLKKTHEDGHTSRNDGTAAVETARNAGIMLPHLLPQRRIDYIMVHGWQYGKSTSPIFIERFGFGVTPTGRALSDHYGLIATVLTPASI
jgi:endonuclease/exonuclease/phosphatase family metal-dependent hydrolase